MCFGIPLGLGQLGGNSVGWGWAGKTLAERELHMGSTGRCCTYGAKHTQFKMFSSQNKSIEHLIELSHGRSPRSLRIVLRVDLRGGHFWVARSLRVGRTAIALRRRRGLVVIGKLEFVIRPENRRKTR